MDIAKDIFNILFFISMSVVAILSYRQAKKTLFSPIKTEIFKIQIDEFKNVLSFFNKKNDHDFNESFDFNGVINLNAALMHHAYIDMFFPDDIKAPDGFIEELKKTSKGMIVSKENMEKYFEGIEAGSELKEKKGKSTKIIDPALKLAKWDEYRHLGVEFTEKYQEELELLTKLASSPILPKELIDLMYEFINSVHHNLEVVGEVINEAAIEMPKLYSTPEDAIKFHPNWIWNKYNHEKKSLDKLSSNILKYLNEYLKINEIMK